MKKTFDLVRRFVRFRVKEAGVRKWHVVEVEMDWPSAQMDEDDIRNWLTTFNENYGYGYSLGKNHYVQAPTPFEHFVLKPNFIDYDIQDFKWKVLLK